MRIAFFVNRFPVLSEAFVVNAAAGLIEAGHEVDFYAFYGAGRDPRASEGLVRAHDMESNAEIYRLRDRSKKRMALAPHAAWKLIRSGGAGPARALDRSIFGAEASDLNALHEASMFRNGGRYDILHCHFSTLTRRVLQHKRAGYLSGKVISHFRGYDVSEVLKSCGSDALSDVFSQADGFIANCDFFQQRILDLGAPAERTTVIPSAVNIATFPRQTPAWSPGQTLELLAVGRLVEKKGFAFAISAVAELASLGVDAKLTIVGEGILRDDLRSLAKSLGVGDRVILVGAEPHPAIAQRLSQSHMFIAPSTTASNGDQDASINTLKEAMAVGLPCVTTNHGGIPELAEGLSGVVMARESNAHDLSVGVQRLMSRRDEWTQLGDQSRSRVLERYDIAAVTDRTVEFYNSILRPEEGRIQKPSEIPHAA